LAGDGVRHRTRDATCATGGIFVTLRIAASTSCRCVCVHGAQRARICAFYHIDGIIV